MNPEKQRYKIRTILRLNHILPPWGIPLTLEEKVIDDRIANNDFKVYEELKLQGKIARGTASLSSIKKEFRDQLVRTNELRFEGINFPLLSETPNEEQQKIFNDLGRTPKIIKPEKESRPIIRRPSSPEYRIWRRTKDGVRKNKTKYEEFNLTVEDIIVPKYCPYLGVKLSIISEEYNNSNYFTIDRIDSSKGYIKGNVQVISRLANRIKNDSTIDQMFDFIIGYIKKHGNKRFKNRLSFEFFPEKILEIFE